MILFLSEGNNNALLTNRGVRMGKAQSSKNTQLVPAESPRKAALMSQDFQKAITDLFNSSAAENDVEKLTITATPTLIEVSARKSDGTVVKNTFTPVSHESVTTYGQVDKADREKEARRLYTTVGLSQTEIAQRLNRSQAWVSGVVRNK